MNQAMGMRDAFRSMGHEVDLHFAAAYEGVDHSIPRGLRDKRRILRSLPEKSAGADLVVLILPSPAYSSDADRIREQIRVPLWVRYDGVLADRQIRLNFRQLWRHPAFYLPRVYWNRMSRARQSRFLADRYLVASRYQREELILTGCPPEKISCIPNLMSDPPAKHRRPAGFVVGYAGHFLPVKGVEVLLEAFSLARKIMPAIRLRLYHSGIGPRQPVEEWIRRGRLENAADVVFGPIDWDRISLMALPFQFSFGTIAYPQTLLECLARGCPVVSTNIPIVDEIVSNEETGVLAPPDDPPALARAIVELLADPARLDRISARQQRLFHEKFAMPVTIRQYADLLSSVDSREIRVG